MPFTSVPSYDLYGPREVTPATGALLEAMERGDEESVAQLMTAHWEELWWALPPALTGEIINCLPEHLVNSSPDMRLVARLSGVRNRGLDLSIDDIDQSEEGHPDTWTADGLLLRAISLRLAGRPVDALDLLDESRDEYAVFCQLREDTSGGRVPSRRLSVGLIAILGERHGVARQQLGAAARALNPVRFPWVPRAASAALALTHALEANHPAARLWIQRADSAPRTQSWAEGRSDDHLALARLQIAIDTLDLEVASQIIANKPSPFDHSYLWPFASELYTQYYLLMQQPQAAQSMWREIQESVPPAHTLQGAAQRVLLEVPLRLSLATEALADAARHMHLTDTPEDSTLAVLADYVAGNSEDALVRATALMPRVHTDPRLLMRLTGIIAGCHHSMGNIEARDHTLAQFLERARVLGLWAAVALSPLPLRPLILARDVPSALRSLLTKPHVMGSTAPAISESLTPAEIEAFKLVAGGRNRKEISALLHLSENTVKTHLRHIYRKLGVSNRAQAIERANEVRALVLRSPEDA